MPIHLLDRQNPAGPDSIGFISIFFRFLSYKDGSILGMKPSSLCMQRHDSFLEHSALHCSAMETTRLSGPRQPSAVR